MIAFLLALAAAAVQHQHSPAAAAPAPNACAAALPGDLKAWSDAHPLDHGIVVGKSADLRALPVTNVRLAVQPSRPLTGSHVATGTFEVRAPGTYRVAAGGVAAPLRPLWLDVAGADGKPLTSTAHGHGPACSSITKVVEFRLTPGHHTFLATGLTTAAPVRVLVVRR